MNKIEGRRQRAREAAYDVKEFTPYVKPGAEAVEAAIETATRVKITDETIEAFDVARTGCGNEGIRMGLRAALEELGFEVEE